jgi:hypothetical protein
MNAFTFRDQIVQSYERFSRSFVRIAAADISKVVDAEYERGRYWPEPLIQINPNYKQGSTVLELAEAGVLLPLESSLFGQTLMAVWLVADMKTANYVMAMVYNLSKAAGNRSASVARISVPGAVERRSRSGRRPAAASS